MKYRLVKRAKGWAVQHYRPPSKEVNWGKTYTVNGIEKTINISRWHTLSTHRFHFVAALRLLILRERARK